MNSIQLSWGEKKKYKLLLEANHHKKKRFKVGNFENLKRGYIQRKEWEAMVEHDFVSGSGKKKKKKERETHSVKKKKKTTEPIREQDKNLLSGQPYQKQWRWFLIQPDPFVVLLYIYVYI